VNKDRRKRLDEATSLIQNIKEDFEKAKGLIEDVAGEEQDSYDNLSEGLQQADRGQAMEAAASALSDAHSTMDIDLDEVLTKIEEASE